MIEIKINLNKRKIYKFIRTTMINKNLIILLMAIGTLIFINRINGESYTEYKKNTRIITTIIYYILSANINRNVRLILFNNLSG